MQTSNGGEEEWRICWLLGRLHRFAASLYEQHKMTNLPVKLSQVERLHQKEGKPQVDMLISKVRKTRHTQVDCNKLYL